MARGRGDAQQEKSKVDRWWWWWKVRKKGVTSIIVKSADLARAAMQGRLFIN